MYEIGLWLSSRLFQARIALLWLLCMLALCLPLVWAGWPTSPTMLAGTALVLAILISGFRLLDDLADLQHDAQYHPQRVLVKSQQRQPFFWLAALLLSLPLLVLPKWWHCIAYCIYLGVLLLVYWLSAGKSRPWRIARSQYVLLKYPVFVYCLLPLVGGWQAGHAWSVAILYLALSWHEKAWQDAVHQS